MGWLMGITIATILGASEVLFEYGPAMTYGNALHDAALGAISGEPIDEAGAVVDVVEVVLAVHATVVFAAALGAYFLERGEAVRRHDRGVGAASAPGDRRPGGAVPPT